MKILLTGATGQVGYELQRSLQTVGEVVALDRTRMDLANLDQLRDVIRSVRPQLIVNPAAYTAVDKAEADSDMAFLINAAAPSAMAEEAKRIGAAMVHFSTDYVFDGSKRGAYLETDLPNPINVYGASKLAGEQAIVASGVAHLIFRTSWVYGSRGKNFLLTMLRLASERDELRVVADQHGAPTWSRTIADTAASIITQARVGGASWWDTNSGIYHLSGQGQTTWHGFTEAIVANAGLACRILPIESAEYPVPARRPTNSVMSSEKLMSRFCSIPAWDAALALCQTK